MGARMAQALIESGHQLVVWNRTQARAAELEGKGAVVATSPADAARRSEVVLTMLADPGALEEVTTGPEGLAAGAEATTVVEMSTVGPAAVARLRERLPDSAGLMDAPVLGSTGEVEARSLRIFMGGPDEVVARWTPLLSELGNPVHVGPLGSGARAKLLANAALLGALTLLGETLALAEALGLDRDAAFEILSLTPLAAQAERRRPAVERGDYPRRFALSLARKDADLILDEGKPGDYRLLGAARSWLADAEAADLAELDYAAVLSFILEAGQTTDR